MQFKILGLDLETIDRLPYSPDLLPTDYHLFWNLDNFLQGNIFDSQQAVEYVLRAFISSCSSGFMQKASINYNENDKNVSMLQKRTLNNQIVLGAQLSSRCS